MYTTSEKSWEIYKMDGNWLNCIENAFKKKIVFFFHFLTIYMKIKGKKNEWWHRQEGVLILVGGVKFLALLFERSKKWR